MKLAITAHGYKATGRVLDSLKGILDSRKKILRQVADEAVSEAKSNIQNQGSVVTGDLLAHVGILAEDSTSIKIGTDKAQGYYLEKGRGPVEPVNKKFLQFIAKDGTEVFTKHVDAAPPRPWLAPAVLAKQSRFNDLMAQEIHRAVVENKDAR